MESETKHFFVFKKPQQRRMCAVATLTHANLYSTRGALPSHVPSAIGTFSEPKLPKRAELLEGAITLAGDANVLKTQPLHLHCHLF